MCNRTAQANQIPRLPARVRHRVVETGHVVPRLAEVLEPRTSSRDCGVRDTHPLLVAHDMRPLAPSCTGKSLNRHGRVALVHSFRIPRHVPNGHAVIEPLWPLATTRGGRCRNRWRFGSPTSRRTTGATKAENDVDGPLDQMTPLVGQGHLAQTHIPLLRPLF